MNKAQAKKFAKAIQETHNMTEAYLKTHPNSSKLAAGKNAHRMLKPEVIVELDKILKAAQSFEVTRDSLIKILGEVIKGWYEGTERTENLIRVCELLSKIVPEFVNRHEVEAYQNMDKPELYKELKEKLGRLSFN